MSEQPKKDERPPPPEGSCHFYVTRKKRYCRFKPAKDAQFCAEHATVHGVDLSRKRIQCPYDVKHTCYADKINHHMKKCPSRPREMPPYYSVGVNAGDDAGEDIPDPKVTVLKVSLEELEALIDKVNKLYDEHIGQIPEDILTHSCLKEELENPTYGTAALRHRRQQASLIGQMGKMGVLRSGVCFLEMGAGKGQLTHWVHEAVKECQDVGFVLIDRSHVRNKMDNLHKEEQVMERIRIDIEHLKLDHVPSIEKHSRQVLAFGKHLCGRATDLALRCALETLSDRNENEEGGTQRKRFKSDKRPLAGAVIALCCHHRCTWTPYVGKHFFKSCGLSARDFQLVSSMSSWATCAWKGWSHSRKTGNRPDKDSQSSQSVLDSTVGNTSDSDAGRVVDDEGEGSKTEENNGRKDGQSVDEEGDLDHQVNEETTNSGINSKLSQEEREMIGRKCKRLIDLGRVKYLEDHGMVSSLKVYIEEFYTPENVVLTASSS